MVEIQSIVHRLIASDTHGAVLATLVKVEGSSYRRPGARLLMTGNGQRIGSISGGCLEEDLIARARHVANTRVPELVTYDTTSENDLIWGVGLGCNGIVNVLIEPVSACPSWATVMANNFRDHRPTKLSIIWQANVSSLIGTHLTEELENVPSDTAVFSDDVQPPPRLLVLGAGDDARPLVRLAKELGWHVTVGDPRGEFATKSRFPTADAVVVSPTSGLIGSIAPPTDALAVVMTHHYVHDVPLLRDLLLRSLTYVGLLGPKKRAAKILKDLRAQGYAFTEAQLQRLHAPVGLDIGAETPEEVALSIISEMRATLAHRDGRPLRERDRPIHDVRNPTMNPQLSSQAGS